MKDLHELPKLRDGLSFLYVEHARVEKEQQAIALYRADGCVSVPAAGLAALLLGPGTNITHDAVRTLAENGCTLLWCGEQGVRCYAQGIGETRKAARLLHQARLCADPALHLAVVLRMYRKRFAEALPADLTLAQIRGREGVRVREAYADAARRYGVVWQGRQYRRDQWEATDPVNRALSAANSCLYGICHAAIVSAGYSTALGFVHTGKQLSFVYDIADLYKTEVTIPVAFKITAEGPTNLESTVRHACRDIFREVRLLDRLVPDLDWVLDATGLGDKDDASDMDSDEALPGGLWDGSEATAMGGQNYGGDDSGKRDAGSAGDDEPVVDRTEGGGVRGQGERDGP